MLVSAKAHRRIGSHRDPQRLQRVLESHQPEADRAVPQVRAARFRDGVEIDVDDVVEHPHRRSSRVRFSRASSSRPSRTWLSRLIEPRLQTATSSSEVLSVISVQRFEEWMTPAWRCGERRLQGSLKVIQGWPVSNSMVSILRQRSVARTCLNTRISPRAAFAS